MATVVKMPKWGLTMTTGTVTDWLRSEGDDVAAGDPLLTVETEKAVNDVEAPSDGVLYRIVAGQGAEVPVSAAVAIIIGPGEVLSDAEVASLIESSAPKRAGAAAGSSGGVVRETRAASRDDSGRINASPAARKLAGELEIDLASVEATGPGGRITSDDVERAAAERDADPTPREESVKLDDGRAINALVAGPGSGGKLLFVHGLGGSLNTWQVVLGELAERFRVAAIDLPGHGASDKSDPAGVDYGVTGLAAAAADAAIVLKMSPAIVVGHSLGGAVAVELALSRPELVRGLVLINSAGLGSDINQQLLDLVAGEPGEATARALLELYYEDKRLVADRGVKEMAQMQLVEGAWGAQQAVARAAFENGHQRLGLADRLGEVRVPVLVIWGAKDEVISLDHGIEALFKLADASLRVLPNIGHVPQVEDAAAVATAIERFVKSLS